MGWTYGMTLESNSFGFPAQRGLQPEGAQRRKKSEQFCPLVQQSLQMCLSAGVCCEADLMLNLHQGRFKPSLVLASISWEQEQS